jgi:hypothetical protein
VFAHHPLSPLAFTMARAAKLADNDGLTRDQSKRK